MPRLPALAAGAIEAGWLAAVLLTPLFLDKTGTHVFEPAKAGVLRALALFSALAWLLKVLCSTGGGATKTADGASGVTSRLRSAPGALALSAALVLLTTALATLLSIGPYESFWGHRENPQGALTTLAYVVLFASVGFGLRTRAQLRRLVSALILPSLPIALYAVFQRFGLEPLKVTMRETEIERVTSLLGQPVFLSAYLGMVMPFTAQRALEAFHARERPGLQRWLAFGSYGLLLALSAVAALLSESRGPLLAIGAAFALGALVIAAQRGSRLLLAGVWVPVLGVAVLAFAMSRGAAENAPARSRAERRAAETFSASGGGGQFRAISWQVAERVFRNAQALELADGSRDTRPALRKLLGYGPELQYAVSPAFYDAELTRLLSYFLTSRYHNDLWDALVGCGIAGLLAWLALQTSVLWLLLRGLGVVATPTRMRSLWLAYGGGALAGALTAVGLRGVPFVFLGLSLGSLAGIALFLSGAALFRSRASTARQEAREPAASEPLLSGLRCAAFAAIVAHAIEVSFSFTVIATGTLFFVACGLALSCACIAEGESGEQAHSGGVLADGALLALVLSALGFVFLGATRLSLRPGTIVWDGLNALSQPADERFPVVLIVVLATLLFGALWSALEAARARGEPALAGHFWRTLALAAGIALVIWLRLAFILAELARPALERGALVLHQLALRSAATRWFYLSAFALTLLIAFGCAQRAPQAGSAPRLAFWRAPVALIGALLMFGLVQVCVLEPATAATAAALGDSFRGQRELGLAEQAYEKAREIQPRADVYDASLGKLYNLQSRADPAHAEVWLERSDRALSEALSKNRAAGEHVVNLALIRGQRAQRAGGSARAELSASVAQLYQRALRLNPQDPALVRNWAATQLNLLQDAEGALASVQRALELEPRNAALHGLLGDIQLKRALAREGEARRALYLSAAGAYGKARELAPRETAFQVNEGKAYLGAGERGKAIASLRAALRVVPASSRAGQAVAALLQRAEGGEPQ